MNLRASLAVAPRLARSYAGRPAQGGQSFARPPSRDGQRADYQQRDGYADRPSHFPTRRYNHPRPPPKSQLSPPVKVRRSDNDNETAEPYLPSPSVPVTLDTLAPNLLLEYRLEMMKRIGSIPSQELLAKGLSNWLAAKRKSEKATLARAVTRLNLAEWKRAKLDEAWVWKRQQEIQAGLSENESTRMEDERVKQRIESRRQAGLYTSVPDAPRQAPLPSLKGLSAQDANIALLERAQHRLSQSHLPHAERTPFPQETRSPARSPARPTDDRDPIDPPAWLKHRRALKADFPKGWEPPKRVSREAMSLIKLLHQSDPAQYTTPVLADRFKISPEAIRRVLKSNFEATSEMEDARIRRKQEQWRVESNMIDEDGGKQIPWSGDSARERAELDKLMRAENKEFTEPKKNRELYKAT